VRLVGLATCVTNVRMVIPAKTVIFVSLVMTSKQTVQNVLTVITLLAEENAGLAQRIAKSVRNTKSVKFVRLVGLAPCVTNVPMVMKAKTVIFVSLVISTKKMMKTDARIAATIALLADLRMPVKSVSPVISLILTDNASNVSPTA